MVSDRHGHPFAEDVYMTARAELADLRARLKSAEMYSTTDAVISTLSEARTVIELTHELSMLPRLRYETGKWLKDHPA